MITEREIYQAEFRRWRERYEQVLDQLPMLLQAMRERVNPLRAIIHADRITGGGADDAPVRLDALDDCDELWAVLVEYVGEVAERLQDPAPGALGASWATEKGVQGLPAWIDSDSLHTAAWGVVAWLADRAEKIHALELVDSEQFLLDLIRRRLAGYVDAPPLTRLSRRRVCSVCGERAVIVDWVLGDAGEARCAVCGAVYARELVTEGKK